MNFKDRFDRLTPIELFEGSKLCFNSFDNHFTVAELAARNKQFGIATSHLILGNEECIKGFLLLAKSLNQNIDWINIIDLFKDHTIKIKEIKKSYELIKVISLLIKAVQTFISLNKKVNAYSIFNTLELLTDSLSMHNWENHIEKATEWWGGSNKLKQKADILIRALRVSGYPFPRLK